VRSSCHRADRSISLEVQPIHADRYWMPRCWGHTNIRFGALKVEASICLLFSGNDVRVRQGELVFAIAVPEGLRIP